MSNIAEAQDHAAMQGKPRKIGKFVTITCGVVFLAAFIGAGAGLLVARKVEVELAKAVSASTYFINEANKLSRRNDGEIQTIAETVYHDGDFNTVSHVFVGAIYNIHQGLTAKLGCYFDATGQAKPQIDMLRAVATRYGSHMISERFDIRKSDLAWDMAVAFCQTQEEKARGQLALPGVLNGAAPGAFEYIGR